MSGSTVSHRVMAAMTQGMCQTSWGAVRWTQNCAIAIPATAGQRPRCPRTIRAPEDTPAEGQNTDMLAGCSTRPSAATSATTK
jgi:hypothetical protein